MPHRMMVIVAYFQCRTKVQYGRDCADFMTCDDDWQMKFPKKKLNVRLEREWKFLKHLSIFTEVFPGRGSRKDNKKRPLLLNVMFKFKA